MNEAFGEFLTEYNKANSYDGFELWKSCGICYRIMRNSLDVHFVLDENENNDRVLCTKCYANMLRKEKITNGNK